MEWRTDSKTPTLTMEDSFSKRHGIMLPPLQKRFDYHTLVLLYRIREKLAPDPIFSHYFPPSYRAHLTIRSESTPSVSPKQKKSATLNSFLPRAIIVSNTLSLMVNHLSLYFVLQRELSLSSHSTTYTLDKESLTGYNSLNPAVSSSIFVGAEREQKLI